MTFITSIIPTSLFLVTYFLFKRAQVGQVLYGFILPALLFKLVLTGIQGWVFIYYYGGRGDIINYFHDANRLVDLAYASPWSYLDLLWRDTFYPISGFYSGNLWEQPRAFFMVKLVSVVNLISFKNFWVASFLLSLLSFIYLWRLANQLVRLYPKTYFAALGAFLLFPSSQFWTSGYFKETIAVVALCGMLMPFLKLLEKGSLSIQDSLWQGFGLILYGYILLQLKFYYLAAFLPCLFSFVFTWYYQEKLATKTTPPGRAWLFYLVVFLILTLGATQLHRTLQLTYLIKAILYNHNMIYQQSLPEDLIHYNTFGMPGFINLNSYAYGLNVFLNSPLALFSALFRPFIGEAGDSKLKLCAALENLGICLALLYAGYWLWRKGIKFKIPAFTQSRGLVLSTALFIIILYVLLALSTPNLGSLHRYKVAGQLFLNYLLAIPFTSSWEPLLRKIGKNWRSFGLGMERPV